jgi:uncharacterized protein DUF5666
VPIPKLSTVFAVGLCAAGAACGGTESLSPAGPSGFRESRSAVIIGQLTGIPAGASTTGTTARAEDSSKLSVTIVGTDIATEVNGIGQFELTGVPPGDVQLRFSGNGVSGTITLTGVAAGDRIHIVVALSGNAARLVREDRDDDDDDDNDDEDEDEFEGAVSGLIGACPSITFTVAGVTVNTNSATRFEDPCSRIANGTRVEVEGNRQANGAILATEVEIDD